MLKTALRCVGLKLSSGHVAILPVIRNLSGNWWRWRNFYYFWTIKVLNQNLYESICEENDGGGDAAVCHRSFCATDAADARVD